MTELPIRYHAEVIVLTEILVDLIRQKAQTVLNGLVDRPKPGDKQRARDALREIIHKNGALWHDIEGKKPVELTTG